MKPKIINSLFFSAFLITVGLSLWPTKYHAAYSSQHPPVTRVKGGECQTQGLIAHWSFNQLDTKHAPDESGNDFNAHYKTKLGHMGYDVFSYPSETAGPVDQALNFEGNQWLSAGNHSCFTTEVFTITAWVWQETDDNKRAVVPTIMAKSSWPYDGWWLCSTSESVQKENRYIDMGIAWGNKTTHIESGYQIPLKEWHHIAITLNNHTQEAQFFIDGKPFGEKHSNIPKWDVNYNHDMFIGEYDGSGRWPWVGKLDDVRFYNVSLDAETIHNIYQETATVATGLVAQR
jgi:hypothetical protein